MRILHTSDWHLGRSFHGAGMLDAQQGFIDWLVALAAEQSVDAVVIAGDVFDRAVPPLAAVDAWERALLGLREHAAVIVTSGNHDSPTRLGFAGPLLGASGIHLRTRVGDIAAPIEVTGRDGVSLNCYGLPYLEPDLHRGELDADRSHAAVLTAAMDRVRADLQRRPGAPALAIAHAFVTASGSSPTTSDSERDLRVGGIADAPAGAFAGVDYVALGHLHGAQRIPGPEGTVVAYSGSPLAFSFSEEAHVKSVSIVDIDGSGRVETSLVPVPVPRRLTTLTGTLEEILDADLDGLADDWVRIVLADERRPDNPMGRIRERLPHAVELVFAARPSLPRSIAGDGAGASAADLDPLAVAEGFVAHVTSTPASPAESRLLADAVESVRIAGTPQ